MKLNPTDAIPREEVEKVLGGMIETLNTAYLMISEDAMEEIVDEDNALFSKILKKKRSS